MTSVSKDGLSSVSYLQLKKVNKDHFAHNYYHWQYIYY